MRDCEQESFSNRLPSQPSTNLRMKETEQKNCHLLWPKVQMFSLVYSKPWRQDAFYLGIGIIRFFLRNPKAFLDINFRNESAISKSLSVQFRERSHFGRQKQSICRREWDLFQFLPKNLAIGLALLGRLERLFFLRLTWVGVKKGAKTSLATSCFDFIERVFFEAYKNEIY